MLKNGVLISSLLLSATLAGCGSDSYSDDDGDGYNEATLASFSLGVSDAPIDEADSVVIEIDSIKLTNLDSSSSTAEVMVDNFTDNSGQSLATIQLDLLEFQGNDQLKIVDESQNIELEAGSYEMELTVVDSGSYVLLDGDAEEHPIKVPSSRLRLGEFVVTLQAEQMGEEPAYTVEFDLRQSLVRRGNANNNQGFIIKPHGVRIVSLAGGITGTVSSELLNLGACLAYLYDSSVTEYADLFDPNDEAFEAPEQAITATAPIAAELVAEDGSFGFHFLNVASYQVALTCGNEDDDNIQYQALTIPNAGELTPNIQTVEVTSGQITEVNF